MRSLQLVLKQYSNPSTGISVRLGADETQKDTETQISSPRQNLDRTSLRRDLQSVKRDNNRYFVICAAMVVVLFIVCVVLVIANLQNAALVKIALSGFGVSAAGLIKVMTNLWR